MCFATMFTSYLIFKQCSRRYLNIYTLHKHRRRGEREPSGEYTCQPRERRNFLRLIKFISPFHYTTMTTQSQVYSVWWWWRRRHYHHERDGKIILFWLAIVFFSALDATASLSALNSHRPLSEYLRLSRASG